MFIKKNKKAGNPDLHYYSAEIINIVGIEKKNISSYLSIKTKREEINFAVNVA